MTNFIWQLLRAFFLGLFRTIQKSELSAGRFRSVGLPAVLIAVALLIYGLPALGHLLGK